MTTERHSYGCQSTALLINGDNCAVCAKRLATLGVEMRLEYLRGELRAERISYGELAELQGLADQIDPSDVELLEAAGVPEF